MSDPLLSVQGLTKRFGGLVAVDDLDFAVESGEILGVIGPNGAGKSTTFNCIMGQYTVDEGSVTFGGDDITNWDTHDIVSRGLSRVSQHSRPIESMTVRENIRLFTMPNSVFSFRGGASDAEIADIASHVGLENSLGEYPSDLTHEDTRRLEIARSLANEPDLLLLDEPFAGFTQDEVRSLREEVEAFREAGITLVVIDHNMKGLMELVDRVVVIHDGQNLAVGSPEEIANDERVADVYLGTDAESEGEQ